MAGVATEETETGSSFEGVSSGQQQSQCQVGEALAECRSSEQVENGSPSTSPPFWDIDDDDDDGGLKPADLYGKYTWKIEKFSQINKRELRSDVFEIGGYKWYILIYPQGCDVCNHLSLFLCVANHDKLLPGWSHFAQFTIAVVNKDPKRSKYSDTLHRFWKKEHDWGWKKFMEQSKVKEGFIDGDNLTIRAQVQVIRERPDRPFRCLDCQYRGELVRVYLSNVEQICRRFVEERRAKLGKLLEDKPRWSSFCAFWLGMDQSTRHHMSREKSESILRVVVKHFFMEKEVTSTLVMDSLYSGLKALESHNNVNKSRGRYLETEDLPVPIVGIETDTFFLVDDVLLLLERAAMEPLPPKDEKGPQNRTKDGAAGEEPHKDTTDRDERRLTELGRRTIEIFVLAHIFSKIEVAYQEAVALKKQEELIREEEAAWLAEIEQKSRRGVDKEKKSKKKQGKQKKNNRKAKDKVKDDKTRCTVQDKIEQDSTTAERKEKAAEPEVVLEKPEIVEDASDASNSMDCVPEILVLDSDDRDVSPVNWDTDTSEVHPPMEASGNVTSGLSGVQNGAEGRFLSAVDDSCSTCSSDSVHSVRSVPQKGNSCYDKNKKSPSRGRNHKSKIFSGSYDWVNGEPKQPFEALQDARITNDSSRSSNVVDHPSPTAGQQEKGEETSSLHKVILIKETVDVQEHGDGGARVNSSPKSPSNGTRLVTPPKLEMKNNAPVGPALVKKPSSNHPKQAVNSVLPTNSSENAATLKPVPQKLVTLIPAGYQKHIGTEKIAAQKVIEPTPLKFAASQPAEKSSGHQKPLGSEKLSSTEVPITSDKPSVPHIPVLSRPFSAPLVAGPRPAVSVVSRGQTAPVLARSVSAAGRLGPETTTAYGTQSYVPQSYRNAMMGGPVAGSSTSYPQNHSTTTSSVLNSSHSYPQVPAGVSAPIFTPQFSDRMKPSVSFRMSSHDDNMLQNGTVWIDCGERDGNHNAMVSEMQNVDLNASTRSKSPGCTTGRHNHGYPDEFPHLDIINYLFDDEHGVGMVDGECQTSSSGPPHITRQYGEPSATGGMYSFQDDGYGGSHRDMIYTNGGQVDDFSMHNHWPPMLNVMRNMDAHAYPPPYHLSDYSNQMNGYTIFRPSNGL